MIRTLKRLWESWERTACRRSSVWGSGTVSIPAPSNSFLNRAAYATASGGGGGAAVKVVMETQETHTQKDNWDDLQEVYKSDLC